MKTKPAKKKISTISKANRIMAKIRAKFTIISKTRDELRDLLDTAADVLDDLDQADDSMEDGLQLIEEALNEISKQL